MKQTAVEWLKDKIQSDMTFMEILGLINQAKAMEKEQHSKTWDVALDKYEVRAGNYMRAYEDFEQYYNETFKSE
jgi:hypothetical protein